jgi:hypothetical protein
MKEAGINATLPLVRNTVVMPVPKYELLDNYEVYLAAQQAGLKEIWCFTIHQEDSDNLIKQREIAKHDVEQYVVKETQPQKADEQNDLDKPSKTMVGFVSAKKIGLSRFLAQTMASKGLWIL